MLLSWIVRLQNESGITVLGVAYRGDIKRNSKSYREAKVSYIFTCSVKSPSIIRMFWYKISQHNKNVPLSVFS